MRSFLADSAGNATPGISIVVPVFNERDNLAPLIREIHDTLGPRLDFELIYVDDGSDDGSWAQLERLSREFPALRLVRHGERRGQSAALRSGAEVARAAWIGCLDGDGQNIPADLLTLLAVRHQHGLDDAPALILGVREQRRDGWRRAAFSRLANGIRNLAIGGSIPDSGCGLRLFRRDDFLSLPPLHSLHWFLPVLYRAYGWSVLLAPVGHRPRQRGRSKYRLSVEALPRLLDLLCLVWLLRAALRRQAPMPEAVRRRYA